MQLASRLRDAAINEASSLRETEGRLTDVIKGSAERLRAMGAAVVEQRVPHHLTLLEDPHAIVRAVLAGGFVMLGGAALPSTAAALAAVSRFAGSGSGTAGTSANAGKVAGSSGGDPVVNGGASSGANAGAGAGAGAGVAPAPQHRVPPPAPQDDGGQEQQTAGSGASQPAPANIAVAGAVHTGCVPAGWHLDYQLPTAATAAGDDDGGDEQQQQQQPGDTGLPLLAALRAELAGELHTVADAASGLTGMTNADVIALVHGRAVDAAAAARALHGLQLLDAAAAAREAELAASAAVAEAAVVGAAADEDQAAAALRSVVRDAAVVVGAAATSDAEASAAAEQLLRDKGWVPQPNNASVQDVVKDAASAAAAAAAAESAASSGALRLVRSQLTSAQDRLDMALQSRAAAERELRRVTAALAQEQKQVRE
jgi:trimeric autotransporter adhesin